jgi:acyl-CoA thioester hydrolase
MADSGAVKRSGGRGPAGLSEFRLRLEVPVRFRDTDAMGHVNNAVYLTYLEIARERYWRELFGLEDYRQVDLVVARIEIDYLSPATAGETLVLGIRASAIGGKSFDFVYGGWEREKGRAVLAARSVQVMYDYASGTTKPVSETVRSAIVAFEPSGTVETRS